MRTILGAILAIFLAGLAAAQTQPPEAPQPTTVTLPAGTRILLAMRNSVTTRTGIEGDGVYLEATEPVALDNHMVVPEGTRFQGTIAAVKRAGKLKGRASLRIRIDRMIYRNGYVVSFDSATRASNGSPNQSRDGKDGTIKAESSIMRDTLLTGVGVAGGGLGGMLAGSTVGSAAGNVSAGARVGAGVGALVGLVSAIAARGQDVVLPQGTRVEVELQSPLELDLAKIPQGSPANYVAPERPAPPERRYERRPGFPGFPGIGCLGGFCG